MGIHPKAATWESAGGNNIAMPNRFTDAHCAFVNANVGVSRRTIKDVAIMFNDEFGLNWTYDEFVQCRSSAIAEGRCRTTYFRNYFKGENSSERQLRHQKGVIVSRLTGGCQYQDDLSSAACQAPTSGRYCEKHVRMGHAAATSASRGGDYIDSSLGKYG